MEIQVGDKFKFSPDAWTRADGNSLNYMPVSTIGEVVQIHEAHHWFRLRYMAKGQACYECFKLPLRERMTKIK